MNLFKKLTLITTLMLASAPSFAADIKTPAEDVFHVTADLDANKSVNLYETLPIQFDSLSPAIPKEIARQTFLLSSLSTNMKAVPVIFLGTKENVILLQQKTDATLSKLPVARVLLNNEAAKKGEHVELLILPVKALNQVMDLIKESPARAYAVLNHNFDASDSKPVTTLESLEVPGHLADTAEKHRPSTSELEPVADNTNTIAAALLTEKKHGGDLDH